MSLASLISRVRLEFSDIGAPFQAQISADGETTRFDLPVSQVDPSGFALFVDASLQTDPDDYSLDAEQGVVTFVAPPAAGAEIVAQGTAYEHFSTSELETFVREAFDKHTHGQIPPVTLDDPPPVGYVALRAVEAPLVAILATVDALWALAVNAAFDINITTPEGISVPRGQRFQQILALIQMLMERYGELARALNVGLYRIQMFDLRRVSRTTNRLVPIYLPKEFDDITYPPTRVLPPIDPKLT